MSEFRKLRMGLVGGGPGSFIGPVHRIAAELDGKIEDWLGFFGSELADGVEDPEQRDSEVFVAALAAPFQAFKNRREILLAPEADADRNRDFGVQDILRFQAFHQAINNQLIIFGRAQMAGDIFEGKKESRKVGELVELLDFGERRAFHAVALAEFEERGGLD